MNDISLGIDDFEIGKNQVYFTIEEGQANLGSLEKALQMIDVAAKTGANAIEFQLAFAGDFYVKNHKGYEIYLEREFSKEQLNQLISHAKNKKIDIIVAPFSAKLIDLVTKLDCTAFNINASDLNNPDILDAVSDSGKPFFLSLLLADEKEIDWAFERISKHSLQRVGLLLGQHTMASGGHGVSLEHTNLGYIKTLKEKYKVPVGFIDHSPLIWMPACAVAAGADIITKHMALSRDLKGPDWEVCLEPGEMEQSIELVKKAKESMSNIHKTLAPGENMDKSVMRRSIVAVRDIGKGSIIGKEDIAFKRPGTGIPPDQYLQIIGRTVNKNISEDILITYDDLN